MHDPWHCLCDYETLEVAPTGNGVLNGLTFVIKDNIHVAGHRTGCDKRLANDSYTHDLKSLIQTAGLWTTLEAAMRAAPPLDLNWAVVKDWNEGSRYILATSESQARDLYSACTARTHGLLAWLKNYW